MFKKILAKLASNPKTYYPLVTIVCLWGLQPLGVDVTPEVRDALTVILMSVAVGLLRRDAVKKKEMNKIEAHLLEMKKSHENASQEVVLLRKEFRQGKPINSPE